MSQKKSKTLSRKSKKFSIPEIERKNVKQGIKTETKIAQYTNGKRINFETKPNLTKPDVESGDGTLLEVKSIREYVNAGSSEGYEHGRVQIRKKELHDLMKNNGWVIIEVRESNKEGLEKASKFRTFYKQAPASKIYNMVKDEQGDEVKLEYSQILELDDFDPNQFR